MDPLETSIEHYEWDVTVHPIVYRRTGVRSFYIDETGIILRNDKPGPSTTPMPEI